MEIFQGELIEESLANPEILKQCNIVSTRVSLVTPEHQTPWLKQWTLHTIVVPADKAADLAGELSRSLDTSHIGSWYVDFKSENQHYVIYPDKVFLIDRSDADQYRRATEYGIGLGIPEQQVDFEPHMRKAI
jgi:hypothetical protein